MKLLLAIAVLTKLYCGLADTFGFGNPYTTYAVDFCFQITVAAALVRLARGTRYQFIAACIAGLCCLQLFVHAITTDNPATGATRAAPWACAFALGLIIWTVGNERAARKSNRHEHD